MGGGGGDWAWKSQKLGVWVTFPNNTGYIFESLYNMKVNVSAKNLNVNV